VVGVSILLIFVTLYVAVAAGTAGHSAGSSPETGLTLLYYTSLPISLYPTLPQNPKIYLQKFRLFYYCQLEYVFVYGVYNNIINRYGLTEYFIVGIPLILLAITLIGIFKKEPNIY